MPDPSQRTVQIDPFRTVVALALLSVPAVFIGVWEVVLALHLLSIGVIGAAVFGSRDIAEPGVP